MSLSSRRQHEFQAPTFFAQIEIAGSRASNRGPAAGSVELKGRCGRIRNQVNQAGAARIQFICLLACPPGLERFQAIHPDIDVITGAIDPTLSDIGYIVPGLGDAGDRYFGTE